MIPPHPQTKIISQTPAVDNILFDIDHSASDIESPICLTPVKAVFNMSEPISLTATGLLYEGNSKEWEPRMRAILAQNGCTFPALRWGLLGPEAAKEMATIIWCHTSPNVKARVPKIDREHPYTLIRALRRRTRPFRLMDLPPEIRLKICLYNSPPSNSKEISLLEPSILSRSFENTKAGSSLHYYQSIANYDSNSCRCISRRHRSTCASHIDMTLNVPCATLSCIPNYGPGRRTPTKSTL